MGRRGNNDVRELEAYTDMWVSLDSDGTQWSMVNYEEGSRYKDNIFSSNEWTEISIKGRNVYRGVWGHTLVQKANKTTAEPELFLIGGKVERENEVNRVYVSRMDFT